MCYVKHVNIRYVCALHLLYYLKFGDELEICDGIIFDLYPGLPQVYCMCINSNHIQCILYNCNVCKCTRTIVLFVREWRNTVDSKLLHQTFVQPVIVFVPTGDNSSRALWNKMVLRIML